MGRIKKYLGEILVVIGSLITTYNLFSFRSSYYGSSEGGLLPSLKMVSTAVGSPATYYYYSNESLFLLSLGVALIVIGLLILMAKRQKNY
jgi:hypothetical protein